MSGETTLVDIGKLAEPVTVLIEKIGDAIGGYFKPYQIRRVAQAKADAEKILALNEINIEEIQYRALNRFLAEEAQKQVNIESISNKALDLVSDDARPQDMDDDWIVNFFDKCRLVSDKDMQILWARILAGEANAPGSYSRHSVNLLNSLDKSDASAFTTLCSFGWFLGDIFPLVYDVHAPIFTANKLTFSTFLHLDEIGLLSLDSAAGYRLTSVKKTARVHYYGTSIEIIFPDDDENELQLGKVMLSRAGRELALVCRSAPVEGYLDYTLERWVEFGLAVASPYPENNERSSDLVHNNR